jgi:CRISPR-associated protein Cmx8
MGKKAAPEVVDIRYDLFDLPTAQHKAGLAGLILAIRSLKERSTKDPEAIPPASVPEIMQGPDDTGVQLRFRQRSVQSLFDDLYDAAIVEVASKSKWKDLEPKREETVSEHDRKTGKQKQVKRFIYDLVQPKGASLAAWLPDMPAEKGWLRLWREMVWQIPRGVPRTREPFEQRAAGIPCKEGAAAWDDLLKAMAAKQNNAFATGAVAGSLWLGAQAANAEAVPFLGRVEHNILLHFWPLTVMITVPQRIDSEGKSKFVGFVIAVPEVSRLKRFCEKLPAAFSRLGTDTRSIRPAQAIIDLPAQGALEFVNSLARLKTAQEEEHPTRSVNAVEFLHLDRQGNNVKLLASGRVVPDFALLDDYRDIAGRPGESPGYRNSLFKAGLIQALLRSKPWWGEMLPLFMGRDAGFFIHADKSPVEVARLRWLWTDVARNRLELDEEKHHDRRRSYMQMSKSDPQTPPPVEPPPLTVLINRLVRSYVNARAEERSGIDLEKFKEGDGQNRRVNWQRVPADFGKERAKVAQSLFLEFRSRRDQAFVHHFAQTLFAVPQYMSETDRDQEQIAHALLYDGRIDDVKTLTLMALSAASWTPQRPTEKGTEE